MAFMKIPFDNTAAAARSSAYIATSQDTTKFTRGPMYGVKNISGSLIDYVTAWYLCFPAAAGARGL